MDMRAQTRKLNMMWILSASLLLLAGAATVKAADENELRISTTSQGQGIQRGGVGVGKTSHDELEALLTFGERSKTTRGSQQKKDFASSLQSGSVSSAVTPNVEFWFYDVDVQLYSDVDRDGYYSGIDLAFDADTVYGVADVYAVIYLSYDFGPWNEYAVTEDFTIFGASANDEYVVETDLVAGYITGDYDILIELFDAVDGSFVADIGPDQSSELSFLPLEDIGRDTPRETTIVVNNGGGGALGMLALLVLFALAAPRLAAVCRSA
jgi:hypothetical protein